MSEHMTSQHLSAQQIHAYQQRSLNPSQRLLISDHLATCGDCRRLLQQSGRTQRAEQALEADLRAALSEEPVHLSYEELTAYVDGRAGQVEGELVEGHSAVCPECAATLQDLMALRALLSSTPKKIYAPALPARLADAVGTIRVAEEGAIRLGEELRTLPASLARRVRELITTGLVTPTRTMRVALSTLGSAPALALRSSSAPGSPQPTPLRPAFVAIRSPTPTLAWEGMAEAQEYLVLVTSSGNEATRKVLWKGSAGKQTALQLPAEAGLERGQVVQWQVVAVVQGQPQPSSFVWFSVLTARALQEVEAAERAYANSALVLASVYETHGLYEEALAQVERLVQWNPDSPLAHAMLEKLRHPLERA